MKKKDLRKLSKQTLAEVRQIAVEAVLSMPRRNISLVARQYKLHRKTLFSWVKKYEDAGKMGKKALACDTRGARKWQNTTLTKREANWVQRTILNKFPDQLQMPFMLWNRLAVQGLIRKKYNKKISLSTVSNLLKMWNMTPQKPKLKCYKQQPEVIQKWIDEEYPKIKKEASKEKASIHWCDETTVSSQEIIAKGYSNKGITPILKTSGSRFAVNMISAITNAGETKFMIFEDKMNTKMFIEFLRRFIKEQKQKAYLIVDNMAVHHAKLVKAWEKKHQDEIKLIYLPAYAPEHNPDEYLNQTLKARLKNRPKDKTRPELRRSVSQEMKRLQNDKKTIKALFDAPQVQYAKGQ